jgi:hypothetical protein
VLIANEATLVDGDRVRTVRIEGDGCIEVADHGVRLRAVDVPAVERGRLVLRTCTPRVERTPESVETNPIAVRPRD